VLVEGDSARFKLRRYDTTHKNDRNPQLFVVGGKETTTMAKLLGHGAHLVSYGGMAKQPLSLPVSLFIFKNLTCRGFWQSHWYKQKTPAERVELMQILVNLMKEDKVWQDHILFFPI
jgi:NADPH:quinone reductase-like Zn-dependent oxidoreductase